MENPQLIMALAKVIIAAAWSDGEMSLSEINSLKDLLFHLPDLTSSDWTELDIYIDHPIDEAERARLLEELKSKLSTKAEVEFGLSNLEEVISSDGVITTEEQAFMEDIRDAINEINTGIFGRIGRLTRGAISRRSKAVSDAPNREQFIEDFIRNKIFYSLRQRLDLDEFEIHFPESDLRKFCLAGGLMAQIANVDRDVTEEEYDAIVNALQIGWGVSKSAASLIAEVAVSEISKDMDLFRLSREFFDCIDPEERLSFLEILFNIAAGDGQVSHDEMEEIRVISKLLKLPHKDFITAKLKIPREQRSG
ncbi:MAG: TerB family tellurite resistance protein [Anaerolineaceae bacterium]|nr:TerB family tellurite resistance protein [Anaerolineaceae bacterium]